LCLDAETARSGFAVLWLSAGNHDQHNTRVWERSIKKSASEVPKYSVASRRTGL